MKSGDKVINKATGSCHFVATVTDDSLSVRDGDYELFSRADFDVVFECSDEEHVATLNSLASKSDQSDPRAKWAQAALAARNAQAAPEAPKTE